MADIEKMDGESLDIVEQNIEQLKALFPSVFSEGKIQFNKLEELLGHYVVEDEDHYNFTWHGKRKAGRLAQTPSTGTLRPCKEESVDWETTENIFIEGDNLEVLKLLQKSYHRQVKMIYIDPPYNTGNDFVYEDNFKDGVKNYLEMTGQLDGEGKKVGTNSSSAGRYHTNWLNMMYPRLKLARNLLRDDGLIFVSIDETEQNNLRKVCDEIFGEENFVENVVWKKRYGAGGGTKGFASLHEYILVYSKQPIDSIEAPLNEEQINAYKSTDEHEDVRGGYITQPLATSSKGERSNLMYTIVHDGKEIKPKPGSRWLWSEQKFLEAYDRNQIVINESKNGFSVRFKQYLKDENGNIRRGKPLSIKADIFTQDATKEVSKLFNKKGIFDFPKPTALLQYFFNIIVNEEIDDSGLYLDFFAGSGSTAHSIMNLNAESGSNHRYILVQLPELVETKTKAHKAGYNNIADISKERIRRAAKKIKDENPDYEGDLGFKVFKLDSSNIKRWDADFDTLEQDLVDAADYLVEGRSDEDVLYELCLKLGLDLSVKIKEETVAGEKLFVLGRGYLVVCLSDNVTMDVVNGIGDLKDKLAPEDGMRVVFKDDGFKDDVIKTNALQTLKRFGITDIKSL